MAQPLLFKLLILGDSNVGKSSLLSRFADNVFGEEHNEKIMDHREKPHNIDGHQTILQIWDTAGQERFRTITNSFYRGAFGVILVYDVTNRESFDNVKDYWLDQVEVNAPRNVNIVVIGNKMDLPETAHMVTQKEVQEWAAAKELSCLTTSAKTGRGVDEAFEHIVRQMLGRKISSGGLTVGDTKKIDAKPPKPSGGGRICTIL
eukprot:TRINITY_DN1745_c0_g1_i1.p1 TRINITY_DN1745_c0_g1~~TRINITY_DN1745_c0_g1_i1.p1  ORF type:complete len:204 (-),score=47.44 TRINITY_DN1745_c0_g1_i1:58-669(-)